MSESENIMDTPSESPNNAFKVMLANEKLPLRVRDEVVGTMEIITLFGNILQLFTANFGNAVVAMLADSKIAHEDDDNDIQSLNSNPAIPLNK